ncbi:MAG: LacI family DNA-binding transcriptional regulator [Amphritea sp.]
MIKDRKVTLRDVANQLGVNTSTVSRALNPKTKGMITPEKVAQIEKVAEELGYVQNVMAYALKTGSSQTIGVIIPDLLNPVFPPILKGILNVLKEASYTPIIAYCENDIDMALDEIKKMKSRQVDGFILASAFREDESVEYCIKQQLPSVTVGRALNVHKVDQIVIDNEAGIKQAISHLISLGHSNIAYISGPQTISDGYQRYQAFRKEMETSGVGLNEELIVYADAFTEDGGRIAAQALLTRDKPFTAVVAANDLIALGCINVLEKAGLRCPQDVSVIGYNNMPYLDQFKKPLTTVGIPRMEMGVKAAQTILERLKNPGAPIQNIVCQPVLLVRESTAIAIKGA